MGALIDVVLPVFLVIGAGYGARWMGWFSDAHADALLDFAQRFAIPALLFLAMAGLDLETGFDGGLLASFYFGVLAAFVLAILGARMIFSRVPEDCVSIGFSAAFSNTVLLGLPITQRAYGVEALAPNYALIAFHAPLLYAIGILSMEVVRSRGTGIGWRVVPRIVRSIMSNAIVIGILLGIAVNLSGLALPFSVDEAAQIIARAGLPAALFGLGAVLYRYRPEGDMRVILMVTATSLILHPAVTWALGSQVFALTTGQLRSAVVTAAMAPGVNAYLFANMYGAAKRVAASSVLLATAMSLVSVWVWLIILP